MSTKHSDSRPLTKLIDRARERKLAIEEIQRAWELDLESRLPSCARVIAAALVLHRAAADQSDGRSICGQRTRRGVEYEVVHVESGIEE